MNYFANGIQQRLQQAFFDNDISLREGSDHIILENSQDKTEEKIRQIIELAGFCPLISKNKIDGNFVVTLVPYQIPECFIDVELPLALKNTEENAPYFNLDEISLLLEDAAFVDGKEDTATEDPWSEVNNFRSIVLSALNSGLSEIISQHVLDEYPVVEIGSGTGYTLPNVISHRTIRIQPSLTECQLLRKSIADPIYQVSIDGFYNRLLESGKKIPLFFGLNVFNTMSPDIRKTSFSQISQLQNAGDRILIMLDTNPLLEEMIKQLEALYPEHVVLPYCPLLNESTKFSVIMVPFEFVQSKPSLDMIVKMIHTEPMILESGRVSQMQYGLHQLQLKFNLTVIDLEDFFAEQVKKELEETGYNAKIYHHASFTTGDLPGGYSEIIQDIVYKPVTDNATVRQWSLTDEKFLNGLARKGLNIPIHFDEEFLLSLREKGQKIFGAEILVIEATKKKSE